MRVGLIGARGYVGSALAAELAQHSLFTVIPVVRGDDWKSKLESVDVIIYAANSGRRFFAEKNPEADFKDSVVKTQNLLKMFPNTRIILVSSISARTQPDTAYGRNRKACELLLDNSRDLVVRLGPMFGGTKSAGALYDILGGRQVFVSEKTRYAYVDVRNNARKIVELLLTSATGLVEIGARDGIELGALAKELASRSQFAGLDDTQIPENPPSDAPSAMEVLVHAKEIQDGALT